MNKNDVVHQILWKREHATLYTNIIQTWNLVMYFIIYVPGVFMCGVVLHVYFPCVLCVCILVCINVHNILSTSQTYIQEGQLDAKMLSALLTGINRAFPFIKSTCLPIGNK